MASLVHPQPPFVGSRHGLLGARSHRGSRAAPRCRATAGDDVPVGVTLRKGVQSDLEIIKAGVFRESMNPLGLDPSRFVVAVDEFDPSAIIGFGQLKPWETLSDRPEGDLVGNVVRGLGLTPNWSGDLLELSSLVVEPKKRGQGVGSAIVRRLVEDARVGSSGGADSSASASVESSTTSSTSNTLPMLCLLTLRKTTLFYEKLGFQQIISDEYVPRPLMVELALGRIVARIVAKDDCVAMKMNWEKEGDM
ncbi:GNAT family N-acetyltransferase [bacterium]|nr:GNAT family N-acetyltransferase [bacterium]